VPGRLQKDKPPQREHRANGVTKQNACQRPEPVSLAGNLENQDAPKGNAATLRLPTDAGHSIRFRGSKREISFGRILTPAISRREREKQSAVSERVRDLLNYLPASDRDLLVALFWHGRTEAEIGRQLGITQRAVNKRKHGALALLVRGTGTVSEEY